MANGVEELINAYRHEGPGEGKISYYDLGDPEALRLNEMLCRELEVPRENQRIAPALFSAEEALIYEEITEKSLAHMVEEAAGKPAPAELHGGAFSDAEPVSLHFSQAPSGAYARKANAAVFAYAKCSLTKQMRRWRLARRAKHLL